MRRETNAPSGFLEPDEGLPHYRLFIPGPVEVSPRVLNAMAKPLVAHYGREWASFYNATTRSPGDMLGTQGRVMIVPGSGSAGLDMALGSVATLGKVAVLENGFFGKRLEQIARAYTQECITVGSQLGRPIDLDDVETTLQQSGSEIRSVVVVHCETSTGVLNPIDELGQLCRRFGVILVVDAVSSLGVEPLRMDDWGIGVCIGFPEGAGRPARSGHCSRRPGCAECSEGAKPTRLVLEPGCVGSLRNGVGRLASISSDSPHKRHQRAEGGDRTHPRGGSGEPLLAA